MKKKPGPPSTFITQFNKSSLKLKKMIIEYYFLIKELDELKETVLLKQNTIEEDEEYINNFVSEFKNINQVGRFVQIIKRNI